MKELTNSKSQSENYEKILTSIKVRLKQRISWIEDKVGKKTKKYLKTQERNSLMRNCENYLLIIGIDEKEE